MKYAKIRVQIPARPPEFIGSQIRGALGYALKRTVCINPKGECEGCFGAANCVYDDFYATRNVYHKYRLDYALGAPRYDFSLVLFDDACAKAPYLVSALYIMLTQIGLGKERVKYDKFGLFVNDELCWDGERLSMPQNYEKEFKFENLAPANRAIITLATPLRIKKENAFLRDGDELELGDIFASVAKRAQKLFGADLSGLCEQASGIVESKNLRFKDLTRLSNRQKTTMNLGGLVGEMTVSNLNAKAWDLLRLGALVGAGKQTVFGLGKIELEEVE